MANLDQDAVGSFTIENTRAMDGRTLGNQNAPVFVVGSARSGNTMLYSLLLSSGRFPVYRTEPCVFDVLVPRFGQFESAKKRRALMAQWVRTRQFRESGLDARDVTEKIVSSVTSPGGFLCSVMDEIARRGGFQRWAVWGPDNLLHVATIARQIPNALFLHIIRDGRDVACAMTRKRFIDPFPWDREHRLCISALHWRWKLERGRRQGAALGHSRYMELRYEDLVLHPEDTVRRVGDFIGEALEYKELCKSKLLALDIPNTSFPEELGRKEFFPVGRWRRQLSTEQIAEIECLIADLLISLGYPLFGDLGRRSLRLRSMAYSYPTYFDLKEWLKLATPFGYFVSTNRLHIDEVEPVNSEAQ